MSTHAPIKWRNPDGTVVMIDLEALPLIDKPGNVVLPNVGIEPNTHPTDPGRLYMIEGPNLLHFGDDGQMYKSTRSYKEHGTGGVTMYKQGPFSEVTP